MSETTAVADGTIFDHAECEGMSVTTLQATRPHQSRYAFEPKAEFAQGRSATPASDAEPRRIQIGPLDV